MKMYFALLVLMTILGSVASLYLKKASGSNGFAATLKNVNLYIGGFLYLSSAVLNIIVLRKLDYSIVLPLTAITYIWTMLLSRIVLKERITLKKIAGVLLILLGTIGISLG